MFRLENVKKQRERRKTKAEKGKDKKGEETSKHENYISGDILRFLTH